MCVSAYLGCSRKTTRFAASNNPVIEPKVRLIGNWDMLALQGGGKEKARRRDPGGESQGPEATAGEPGKQEQKKREKPKEGQK